MARRSRSVLQEVPDDSDGSVPDHGSDIASSISSRSSDLFIVDLQSDAGQSLVESDLSREQASAVVEVPFFDGEGDYAAVPGEKIVREIIREIEGGEGVKYEAVFKDNHTEVVSLDLSAKTV